jgi:acyl carrier protein
VTTGADVEVTVRGFVIREFLPGESPDTLAFDTPLIEGGILDSLGTIKLVTYLESTFGIILDAHELGPDNLGTLADIGRLVRRKQDGR